MEQCVLMSGRGLRRQDRAAGEITLGIQRTAPMTSPCFATVTCEDTVLHPVGWDIEPLPIDEHLHTFERQTIMRRVAVGIVTAGQT